MPEAMRGAGGGVKELMELSKALLVPLAPSSGIADGDYTKI